MADTVWSPVNIPLRIYQGHHFHRELERAIDDVTGAPFDFVAWGGTARMEVRRQDGQLVTTFATSGAVGTITLTEEGEVTLDLSADETAALAPTTEYAGANHGPYYHQLVFIGSDETPWLRATGEVLVIKNVTDPTPEVET